MFNRTKKARTQLTVMMVASLTIRSFLLKVSIRGRLRFPEESPIWPLLASFERHAETVGTLFQRHIPSGSVNQLTQGIFEDLRCLPDDKLTINSHMATHHGILFCIVFRLISSCVLAFFIRQFGVPRNYHVFLYESMLGAHRRWIVGHRNGKNDGMAMLKNFWSSFLVDFLRESRTLSCFVELTSPKTLGRHEWEFEGGFQFMGESISPGSYVIYLDESGNKLGKVSRLIRRGGSLFVYVHQLDIQTINQDFITQCIIVDPEPFVIHFNRIFDQELQYHLQNDPLSARVRKVFLLKVDGGFKVCIHII